MNLSIELLTHLLAQKAIHVTIPQLQAALPELLEAVSYKALCEIKAILEDDALTDRDCFQKIEAIVSVFEKIGSGAGNRHDFG